MIRKLRYHGPILLDGSYGTMILLYRIGVTYGSYDITWSLKGLTLKSRWRPTIYIYIFDGHTWQRVDERGAARLARVFVVLSTRIAGACGLLQS